MQVWGKGKYTSEHLIRVRWSEAHTSRTFTVAEGWVENIAGSKEIGHHLDVWVSFRVPKDDGQGHRVVGHETPPSCPTFARLRSKSTFKSWLRGDVVLRHVFRTLLQIVQGSLRSGTQIWFDQSKMMRSSGEDDWGKTIYLHSDEQWQRMDSIAPRSKYQRLLSGLPNAGSAGTTPS